MQVQGQDGERQSWRGLRMASPPDPLALEAERATFETSASQPVGTRLRGYLCLLGPGYLQSAMTLGVPF